MTIGLAHIETMIQLIGNGHAKYHHLKELQVIKEQEKSFTALKGMIGWRFYFGSHTSQVLSGSSDGLYYYLLVSLSRFGYKLTS